MAEFLNAISCWEGGRGRGFVRHANINSASPTGSGEMRPVTLGCIGIGRGIRSNFPDSSRQEILSAKLVVDSRGKSRTPTCLGSVKDINSLHPSRSSHLIQSCMEKVDRQSEETLFDRGQGGDVKTFAFPTHSMTLNSAPPANLKPMGHVLVRDFALPPKPPEHDQSSGSVSAGTIHPSVMTPGALNDKVLVISEYVNPLESKVVFDAGQPILNSFMGTQSPHTSTVTTAFLPGVHHPEKDSKRHTESEPPMSLEPTLANILHHTFQLLSQRPGTFIGVMPALTSILKVNIQQEADVNEIIDSLCFASIRDENFRYNGARVCTHLVKELQSFRFLEHLLERCQQEFDKGWDSIWFAGEENLCGKVALFVGELTVQLQAEVGQPTEILIRFLLHLLYQLLKSDDEMLLKCMVQLLKLTGARLKVIVPKDLNQIMTEIRQSVLLKASSRKSRELLLSVVELDALGWMRVDEQNDDFRNNSPATATCPLLTEEAKAVDSSLEDQNVMDSLSNLPEELAADTSFGNIDLDDSVEDLMEEECIGLEIAHCYEQYLREMGKEEV